MRLRTSATALLAATVVALPALSVAATSASATTSAAGEAATVARPVAARGGVGGWSTLSTGETRIIDAVAMHRAADGNLHTVHAQKLPSGNVGYVHTLISADGAVQRTTTLPMDVPAIGGHPTLQTTPSGALRVVYTSNDASSDFRNGRLAQATSTDGGVTWTVHEESLSRDGSTWGDFGHDATFLPDGTTIQAWASSSGIAWRTGTISTGKPWDAPADQVAQPGGYEVAVERVGDTVQVAWQSLSSGDSAIMVRQIWPTVSEATVAPGSTESWARAQVPFVSRPDGSSWLAYNTAALADLVVWQLGSGSPVKVAKDTDSEEYDVAAGPDGRLWAVWHGDEETWVAHTGPQGTGFSTPQRIKHPIGVSRVYGIQVEGGVGRADVTFVGINGVHHTQVQPGLTVRAKPGRLKAKRAKKVTFTVTDGSDRLAGALVKAGGKKCRTNARGVCKVKVVARKPGKVKAKITRPGFTATSLKIKVKR